MLAYRIDDTHKERYAPTLTIAKLVAENGFTVVDREGDVVELRFSKPDVWIELVNIPSNQDGIIQILNGEHEPKPIRRWERVGARGGWRETWRDLSDAPAQAINPRKRNITTKRAAKIINEATNQEQA
jgi:hypothetical protein